ncbi:Asp-tRNA(Asn)/Glu-tRNA(Gln) amidotransferase subunit GatC [Patescibacteria group bacterium]
MLSKKEVEHIAKLARLGLDKKEIEKFRKELSPILDYIENLKKVDISGTKAMSHSVELENILREDEVPNNKDKTDLLGLAPDVKDGYLKVKSIF